MWLLLQGELTTGAWSEKSETIQFADFNFTITRHFLKEHDSGEDKQEDGSRGKEEEIGDKEQQENETEKGFLLQKKKKKNVAQDTARCGMNMSFIISILNETVYICSTYFL